MPQRAHQGEVAGTRWTPGQYLKFSQERLRPAVELLDRIPLEAPGVIYDLGCGSGNITRLLAKRWSSSKVYGIDNSPQMLAEAVAEPSTTIRWADVDIRSWVPEENPDLIYSNASLHWVNGHSELFTCLAGYLNPGGCLAVQMPLSWDLPSHRLMRDTLADGGPDGKPVGEASLLAALSNKWVEDSEFYYDILSPCTRRLDIWETRYLHALEGDDPVFEWVMGSGLRPILNGLSDTERNRFLKVYKQRLRDAYPKGSGNRTLYPFPRLFIVALV